MDATVVHEMRVCSHLIDKGLDAGACGECFSCIVGRYNRLHLDMSALARNLRAQAKDALVGGGHGCEDKALVLREAARRIEERLG